MNAIAVEKGREEPFRIDRTLLAIVALGLVLRIAFMIALPQEPYSDGLFYVERAREMISGMGYQEGGHPTAFWPMGYPVLLSLTMLVSGPSLIGAMVMNLVGAAATIIAVAWGGVGIAGQRRIGHLAALLYAIYPAHIAYAGAPMTEVVSTTIAIWATWALVSARGRVVRYLLAGLLFGLAVTMRAQLLYFPVGVAIAIELVGPRVNVVNLLKGLIVTYLAIFVVLTPLALRNQAALGSFVLVSTNGGAALRIGAMDDADGNYIEWNKARSEADGIPWDQRVSRQVEADKIFRDKAVAWIKAHPARYMSLMPNKIIALWLKDSDAFWGVDISHPKLGLPLKIMQFADQAYYVLILLLSIPCLIAGLIGLFLRNPARARLLLLFLMPVFVTLVSAVFTGQTRYHFPAMPFLIVAAAWTIVRLLRGRFATPDDKVRALV